MVDCVNCPCVDSKQVKFNMIINNNTLREPLNSIDDCALVELNPRMLLLAIIQYILHFVLSIKLDNSPEHNSLRRRQ